MRIDFNFGCCQFYIFGIITRNDISTHSMITECLVFVRHYTYILYILYEIRKPKYIIIK